MRYTRNIRELKERKTPPRMIGLTGGIGSGKTVATDALRAAGFTVIDADEISRGMFAKGTDGERELTALFPLAARSDGSLDRAQLRAIISEDRTARTALDAFTHPRIIAEIKRLLSCAAPERYPIILSAPLLFESALARLCDATVCIYCPRSLRVKRLTARDGLTTADAERIIDAQIPDTERATLSDYIIPSDRDMSDFTAEVLELFKRLSAKA